MDRSLSPTLLHRVFETKALRRRDFFLLAGFDWLWPGTWFPRHVRLAEATFHELRRGRDRRRYIWIHGDEQTAGEVLRAHMRSVSGRAYLVENDQRNVRLMGGALDPNRMFSRIGAEQNLRKLNPEWSSSQVEQALARLDRERSRFLSQVLPRDSGALIVALHNNGPDYSVNDEVPISDAVSLNDARHPDEFLLCTSRTDFERLASGSFNVVLQRKAPPDDDGSLSRLCAARGLRYVNVEAAHGNAPGQARMLQWLEQVL
jgi:hypothetical protein